MDYLQKKLGRSDFPEDTKHIKAVLHDRGIDVTNTEINVLYPYWCQDWWCAGWLVPDEDTIRLFGDWLESKE